MKTWWKCSVLCMTMLLCLSVFAIGCGDEEEDKSEGPIKIGAVLCLSGAAEPLGKPEEKAIRLYVEQLNDRGGINGREVEVIIEDDESRQEKALDAVNMLIEQENVIAIIGSSTTGNTLAMKNATRTAEVPQVCCAAGVSITATDNEWIFRTPPTDAVAVEKVLDYIKNSLELKKIAILHASDPFGTDGRNVLREMSPDFDIEIIAEEGYNNDDPDESFDTYITNVMRDNPEAIVVWGTNPGPSKIARRMKDKGITVPFIGSHGIANMKFIELAEDAAEDVVFPAGRVLIWDTFDEGSEQGELVRKFAKDYKDKYGEEINTFAGHGWDAMLILEEALKNAGDEPTRASVRDAIEKIRGLVGTAGVFNFSPTDHDGLDSDSLIMIRVKDDSWVEEK